MRHIKRRGTNKSGVGLLHAKTERGAGRVLTANPALLPQEKRERRDLLLSLHVGGPKGPAAVMAAMAPSQGPGQATEKSEVQRTRRKFCIGIGINSRAARRQPRAPGAPREPHPQPGPLRFSFPCVQELHPGFGPALASSHLPEPPPGHSREAQRHTNAGVAAVTALTLSSVCSGYEAAMGRKLGRLVGPMGLAEAWRGARCPLPSPAPPQAGPLRAHP